jgi:hypothetical protein
MPVDPAYQVVSRDDFGAMIAPDRYARRSPLFEEIIARTEEHFWNPEDPDYVDFATPLPAGETIVPEWFVLESHTAAWDRLDEGQRIRFANESARWSLSNILHGEAGALGLSANLCEMFLDPGAQEYAANQVREEARHVHAFTRYMAARFPGVAPYPVGDTVGDLLKELVATPVVYKKIVGMQMLVEGVAMGAFATLFKVSNDALLRRVCQLVMTDEAFHHRFGKIWARDTMPKLSPAEHEAVEDWAVECFETLLFNLVNPKQKRLIYPQFGLDWEWVRGAVMEAVSDDDRRQLMRRSSNVFRTLVKTLHVAGIITERTRARYAMWVDMDELAAESDRMVGDDIAEEGIRTLTEINAVKRKVVRKRTGDGRPTA